MHQTQITRYNTKTNYTVYFFLLSENEFHSKHEWREVENFKERKSEPDYVRRKVWTVRQVYLGTWAFRNTTMWAHTDVF